MLRFTAHASQMLHDSDSSVREVVWSQTRVECSHIGKLAPAQVVQVADDTSEEEGSEQVEASEEEEEVGMCDSNCCALGHVHPEPLSTNRKRRKCSAEGGCKGHVVCWRIGEAGEIRFARLPDCEGLPLNVEYAERHVTVAAASMIGLMSQLEDLTDEDRRMQLVATRAAITTLRTQLEAYEEAYEAEAEAAPPLPAPAAAGRGGGRAAGVAGRGRGGSRGRGRA
jgi:hypothetical protein